MDLQYMCLRTALTSCGQHTNQLQNRFITCSHRNCIWRNGYLFNNAKLQMHIYRIFFSFSVCFRCVLFILFLRYWFSWNGTNWHNAYQCKHVKYQLNEPMHSYFAQAKQIFILSFCFVCSCICVLHRRCTLFRLADN